VPSFSLRDVGSDGRSVVAIALRLDRAVAGASGLAADAVTPEALSAILQIARVFEDGWDFLSPDDVEEGFDVFALRVLAVPKAPAAAP